METGGVSAAGVGAPLRGAAKRAPAQVQRTQYSPLTDVTRVEMMSETFRRLEIIAGASIVHWRRQAEQTTRLRRRWR